MSVFGRFGVAVETEHRGDRVRDQNPSDLYLPNGTVVSSQHTGFLIAALVGVDEQWRAFFDRQRQAA